MVLGFRSYGVVAPAIAFFTANFSWLWLPVMWYIGMAVLSVAGRSLLKQIGLEDTGSRFGMHKDLEAAKNYFRKKSIFK